MKFCKILYSSALAVSLSSTSAHAVAKIPGCEFVKPGVSDIAGAKTVIVKLRVECIPKIARVNACVVRSRLLMESINDLTNIFLVGDKSKPLMVEAAAKGSFDRSAVDMSLWNNFAVLEKDYQASLDAVDAFVAKFKQKSDDNVKFEAFIAELDRGYNVNAEALSNLSLKESALLNYIDQATAALENSADSTRPEIQWLASDACKDAELAPVLALAESSIKKIVDRIATLQGFIVRAREAREHLIQYTYAAIRHDAETKYREKTMQDLASLGGKIEAILHANKLMVEFDLWTSALARDNERGSVDSVFLQFEASQRMYAIELVTAQDFRDRMVLATESFPEVGAPYFPRIDAIIAGMNQSIGRNEKLGWAGYLSRQKLLAEKRISMADRYPAACVASLKAFVEQLESVTSIDLYRQSECKYKAAVKLCEVKK